MLVVEEGKSESEARRTYAVVTLANYILVPLELFGELCAVLVYYFAIREIMIYHVRRM